MKMEKLFLLKMLPVILKKGEKMLKIRGSPRIFFPFFKFASLLAEAKKSRTEQNFILFNVPRPHVGGIKEIRRKAKSKSCFP